MRRPVLLSLFVGAMLGIGLTAAAGAATLSGSASYRERMALPPDAVFEATLEAPAQGGQAARVLGQVRLTPPGQVPLHFAIDYDGAGVQAGQTYVLRARITQHDKLLFSGKRALPALSAEGASTQLTLRRKASRAAFNVPAAPPADAAASEPLAAPANAGLGDTYWKLSVLQGEVLDPASTTREAHLQLSAADGRVTGSSGCNRIRGFYSEDGSALKFGKLALTEMACSRGMELEQRFLAVLAEVSAWQRKAEKLYLLDAQGRELARFEAAAPR